jgi:hypothetical protein
MTKWLAHGNSPSQNRFLRGVLFYFVEKSLKAENQTHMGFGIQKTQYG